MVGRMRDSNLLKPEVRIEVGSVDGEVGTKPHFALPNPHPRLQRSATPSSPSTPRSRSSRPLLGRTRQASPSS
jgi:hypothetical protein